MSLPSTAMRPSRGKVWLHLTVGESVGKPLSEWGYRTPRFPGGIKGSDLVTVTSEIRQETMITWFLANHVPAQGRYFGFSEANTEHRSGAFNTSAFNEHAFNGGIEIAGLGQAPFFNGGTASDLLKAEFSKVVDEAMLAKVGSLFDGLWEALPMTPYVDIENQTSVQLSGLIVSALGELIELVHKLSPQHGGIGHNGPPEGSLPVSEADRGHLLTVCADMKIAVSCEDFSAASHTWDIAKPVIGKIGQYVDTYISGFLPPFALFSAPLAADYIGNMIGLWDKAQAIELMLELAKHLH